MSAPKSDPTERERLARLIESEIHTCDSMNALTTEKYSEHIAEKLLADGWVREGAPRTPAPTEDLPPIKITAEVHCQCGTDFERDFTVEPATLRTAIDYARKQLAGRGERET